MKSYWIIVCSACALGLVVLLSTRPSAPSSSTEVPQGQRGGDATVVAPGLPVAATFTAVEAEGSADATGALAAERAASFREIGDEAPPQIAVAAMLVGDPSTGAVYAAVNPDRRWPIASITKLFTAAYATSTLAATSTVTISAEDIARVADAAEGKLAAGQSFEVRDLIRMMLMISSNEAAEALAFAGGREATIQSMNTLAAEWGLLQTYLADPTGLSVANQSTARDLLMLSRAVLRNAPELLRMSRAPKATIIERTAKKNVVLQNINAFAGQAGFLGGKTGFIEESQGNLLSVFSQGGRPVTVVVLGSADRFKDTEQLIAWFRKNYK